MDARDVVTCVAGARATNARASVIQLLVVIEEGISPLQVTIYQRGKNTCTRTSSVLLRLCLTVLADDAVSWPVAHKSVERDEMKFLASTRSAFIGNNNRLACSVPKLLHPYVSICRRQKVKVENQRD